MIFVDTNYFLRYLLNDVPEQSQEAKKLFLAASERNILLATSSLVIFEIFWVLRSFYYLEKEDSVKALHNILKLSFIQLTDREIIHKALGMFEKTKLDLEDCYNFYYAKSHGVKSGDFKTFDKKLEREFSK